MAEVLLTSTLSCFPLPWHLVLPHPLCCLPRRYLAVMGTLLAQRRESLRWLSMTLASTYLLRPCPTPGLIRLLRSHRSTVAQLWTSVHYSGPGCAHTLPLSATLCIILNPVVTTLPRLPCCTMSSPCSICIFYLVVFSPDLTYFRWT